MKPNRSEYPLTRFIGMLWTYSPDQLRNADPGKAARHYKISAAHAAGYIELQKSQAGIISEPGEGV